MTRTLSALGSVSAQGGSTVHTSVLIATTNYNVKPGWARAKPLALVYCSLPTKSLHVASHTSIFVHRLISYLLVYTFV